MRKEATKFATQPMWVRVILILATACLMISAYGLMFASSYLFQPFSLTTDRCTLGTGVYNVIPAIGASRMGVGALAMLGTAIVLARVYTMWANRVTKMALARVSASLQAGSLAAATCWLAGCYLLPAAAAACALLSCGSLSLTWLPSRCCAVRRALRRHMQSDANSTSPKPSRLDDHWWQIVGAERICAPASAPLRGSRRHCCGTIGRRWCRSGASRRSTIGCRASRALRRDRCVVRVKPYVCSVDKAGAPCSVWYVFRACVLYCGERVFVCACMSVDLSRASRAPVKCAELEDPSRSSRARGQCAARSTVLEIGGGRLSVGSLHLRVFRSI